MIDKMLNQTLLFGNLKLAFSLPGINAKRKTPLTRSRKDNYHLMIHLNFKKCIKVLHPKEAISQIGLTQQQIKFTSVLKLKNQYANSENILMNNIQALILK